MKKIIVSLVAALIFAVTLQSVSALSPALSDYYSDVMSGQRYFEAIEFISEEGIVNGYDDGTYKPENLLNRAELLKIIIEAEYVNEFDAYSNVSCFDDVDAGEWFTPYVCFAKDEGFVVGYDDETFRPTDKINLVEAVKIAMEVFGYEYEETDPWYKGLIDVATDGNFIPLDFISFDQYMDRGEMADLITRVLKEESGEQADYLGMWEPYVVSFDNLDSNADTEPVYCVGDFQYMLVGGTYEPWDEAGTTCTCQADGTFDCEETLYGDYCLFGGEIYDIGDEFPDTDSCNTCTCEANQNGAGYVSCTEINCPYCEFDGETYDVGDEFPDIDSCNTCECVDVNGNVGVSCTEINCPYCEYGGVNYEHGESVVQGSCVECTCDNGEWVCGINYCI